MVPTAAADGCNAAGTSVPGGWMALPAEDTAITPGTPAGASSIPRKSLPYLTSSVSPGNGSMPWLSLATTPTFDIVRVSPDPVSVTVARLSCTCSLPAAAKMATPRSVQYLTASVHKKKSSMFSLAKSGSLGSLKPPIEKLMASTSALQAWIIPSTIQLVSPPNGVASALIPMTVTFG